MKSGYQAPAIDRVMRRIVRVTESGCWIFMGALTDSGYGAVGKGGRGGGTDRAHRITYNHFVGAIPEGLFVCHHCDVRACCNPEHLFLGTNAENMEDCRRKGRASKPPANTHIKGSVHVAHKLTENDIPKIRALRASGLSYNAIAAQFPVTWSVIYRIIKGDSWKHV